MTTHRNRRRLLRLLLAAPLAGCAPDRRSAGAPAPAAQTPSPAQPPLPSPVPQTPSPAQPDRSITADRAVAQPLQPLRVTARCDGASGPAELRIFDGRGRQVDTWPLTIVAGAAEVTIAPRGALGLHAAEVWLAGALVIAQPTLFTLEATTAIATGQPRFDDLLRQTVGFLGQCARSYQLEGRAVHGYRSPDNPLLWLRDHTYQMRGARYVDPQVTSLPDAFASAQRADGSLPDFLAYPEVGVDQPGRKQVEADVEYLFVQAIYEAWQVSGDDVWLAGKLAPMRDAIGYTMGDAQRWDAERGLVKRAYTIDTWDFSYGPTTKDPSNGQPAPRHWLDDATIWGIFHGDNTGLAHALRLLARMERRVGDTSLAERWDAAADALMARLTKTSWNGSFYTHFVPLAPFEPPGVDAAAQLSLSNAIALNRSVGSAKSRRKIVETYFQRGERRGPVFAEWYAIDPPFPKGSYGLAGRLGERPGEYVNGGVMPLVGGELARGAFGHGAESYGFAILHRYAFLVETTGASYLWYYPAGNPGISGVDTLATDGWGAAAMLAALAEGAAGIVDEDILYRSVSLSPRWQAADDVTSATIVLRYAASDAYAAYRWNGGPASQTLTYATSGERARIRLLLPEGVRQIAALTVDGQPADATIADVFGSRYCELAIESGHATVAVTW